MEERLNKIIDILVYYTGLRPIYLSVIMFAIILYFEKDVFMNWEDASRIDKKWAIIALVCFVLFLVMGIVVFVSST